MNIFEHFIKSETGIYAGKHVIVDLWGVVNHSQESEIVECFSQACVDAGATVLFKHCHHFGEGAGTTGVVVLSESHLSWHAWPEASMVAIDIFMCGQADPEMALPRIKDFWKPKTIDFSIMQRGIVKPHKLPFDITHFVAKS